MQKKIINEMKKCILYHLQLVCFFNKRDETIHGKSVHFYVTNFNNRLEAKYGSLYNNKDLSNKFDSLIILLKNENKKVNEFLLNY